MRASSRQGQLLWTALTLAAWCGAGCGPRVGGSCTSGNAPSCEDKSHALECRSGKWVADDCFGPAGCAQVGSDIHCDYSGDRSGDLCPMSLDATGMCAPGGTAVLECRSGTVALTSTCQTCYVQNGLVICR